MYYLVGFSEMSLLRRLKQKSSRKSGKGRPTTTKSWKSVSVEDLEGGVAGQLLGVEVLDPNNDEYDQLINALKPTTQQEKDDEEEHVVKGSILKKRRASEEVVEGSIRGDKKSKNKKKKKTTVEDISPITRIEDLSDMNEWKSISSSIPDEILMGLKVLMMSSITT